MSIVSLNFIQPNLPDLEKLHIYESATKDGAYALIETVEEIGTYGNYISRYTTTLATSVNNWFQIEWEDNKGALTGRSEPRQGSALTLVAEIVDRMMVRDSTLIEQVALEEAEAAIEDVFGADPYSIDRATPTYNQKSGITFLALARTYISTLVATVQGTSDSYTAGLVGQSAGASSSTKVDWKFIDGLIDQANALLNRRYSAIMLLEDVEVAGLSTTQSRIAVDLTRSIMEIEA